MSFSSHNVIPMEIPPDFDFSKSTEENYASADPTFVGEFVHIRSLLDYNYHLHYTPERQYFQDSIIKLFEASVVENKTTCDSNLVNWLVFTAGPMGAGKGHTLNWLQEQGLFPLDSFVQVDPDNIRFLLPEFTEYIKIDPATAGYMTQKEVGYLTEILTLDALRKKKNVLEHGSLRNVTWYSLHIDYLRKNFPSVKLAIIRVTASSETILARAARRAQVTGRLVPAEIMQEAIDQVPKSMRVLIPKVDYAVTFSNEDGDLPHMLYKYKSVSCSDLRRLADDSRACLAAAEGCPGAQGRGSDLGTQGLDLEEQWLRQRQSARITWLAAAQMQHAAIARTSARADALLVPSGSQLSEQQEEYARELQHWQEQAQGSEHWREKFKAVWCLKNE